MQTAYHIHALVQELKDFLDEAALLETEFFKKARESFILFKGKGGTQALGLAFHPVGFGSFLLPRSKINVGTNEKPWPFFQPAYGAKVRSIRQYYLDRIFRIDLKKEDESFAIVCEAIGPNGNFWLLDQDDKIIATLRKREYDSKKVYTPPPGPAKLNPFYCSFEEFQEAAVADDTTIFDAVKKTMAGFDDLLTAEVLKRKDFESEMEITELGVHRLKELYEGIYELARLFDYYDKGYLYIDPVAVAPFKFKAHPNEPEKYKNLSMAVSFAIRGRKIQKAEVSEKKKLTTAINRHVKKLQKRIANIEKDLETADKADLFRKVAELLKAYLPKIKKGMDKIELEDIHVGEGKKLAIKLDPALSPVENAELYYKRYKKAREGAELLKRRLEISKGELEAAEAMASDFESDFETAQKKYESELKEILPGTSSQSSKALRLPYREYTLNSGVRIFVGKDGSDNDETTFHHAKPYELWFHASQCPGSHTVMKFPNKSFTPSKQEIAETAAAAAWFSKARKSASVPVIYTEKKYVRKPRKAKPGLVTVERETMVMVEPKKPE